jgi:hypothetical protein
MTHTYACGPQKLHQAYRLLRTRRSWVQVLPGAPIFKELRAASEVVSPVAGPFFHSTGAPALATRSTATTRVIPPISPVDAIGRIMAEDALASLGQPVMALNIPPEMRIYICSK